MAAKTEDKVKQEEKKVEEVPLPNISPDLTSIIVTLTYLPYDPLTFKLKRSTGEQLRLLQAEFYNLSEKEQKAQQTKYRIQFISELLKERPQNVPGFPEGEDFKKAFIDYFSNVELEDIVDNIWTSYQKQSYPKELMSMLFD